MVHRALFTATTSPRYLSIKALHFFTKAPKRMQISRKKYVQNLGHPEVIFAPVKHGQTVNSVYVDMVIVR
jgi:hypothetical protein